MLSHFIEEKYSYCNKRRITSKFADKTTETSKITGEERQIL